ncbi:hypothetical protein [Sporosarcina sp. FA15]|uniref:hypothetical protein n=1 Tax=Sporosarcina sp. FA15 TaxID=3413031 RepID=UPI003F65ED0A
MYSIFGLLGLNDLYTITEMSLCVGMRLRRITTHFFGNRMVLIHPSLSKWIRTQSAKAFRDEKIAGLLIWIIAAKDAILAAEVFSIVLSFLVKEESLS